MVVQMIPSGHRLQRAAKQPWTPPIGQSLFRRHPLLLIQSFSPEIGIRLVKQR